MNLNANVTMELKKKSIVLSILGDIIVYIEINVWCVNFEAKKS